MMIGPDHKWLIYRGPIRLYFNRRNDYPWVASVDQGTQDTEEIVTGWVLHRWEGKSVFRQGIRSPDGSPQFWLEGNAIVVITNDDQAHVWPI